ncbi:sensor histidine kinase [Paraflavitalea pollutisoli]|uniref:sensor histidine kinase n=1 Tax=Paraflavitalea pollutisoli TaxID=3034143 RepID=UPI0023EAA811|nr:histidine kinase [Paraflavitalea sp. H1-2-19X]
MDRLPTKQQREIIFNTAFWTVYFLYEWFGLAALSGQYRLYFLNACMALPLSFLVAWITVHVLIKKFYLPGKHWQFWVLQISLSLVLLLIRRHFNYYVLYPRYAPFAQQVPLYSFGKMIVEIFNLYVITGVYALFYFVKSWYEEKERAQNLLQEKTMAELELLKSQVQPHFIFNALNNIYATALKTSPDTAKLVAHLSSFLNYNLYEARQDFVSLNSEIAYLRHYIELQKNRYGNKLDASINIYDDLTDLYIPPLLLLPLIENSFKHGIASSIGEGWIRVDVARQPGSFSVKIENSVEEKSTTTEPQPGGLGIRNVEKRLQLLYPDTHELKIVAEPHAYLVILKIKTAG